mgnify:CR=1 FL=1
MFEVFRADLLANLEVVFLVGLAVVSYLIMEVFPNRIITGKLLKKLIPGLGKDEVRILSIKYSGILWLGIIPLLVWTLVNNVSLSSVGLSFHNFHVTLRWILILAPVPVIINFFAARSPKNLALYPLVRKPEWNLRILLTDMLSWLFYLVGYEFFFRGFMLLGMIPLLGVWPSIVINIMAYSFVHIHKGGREAFGSIPMGLLLCLITIDTGNIWAAFFIHLSLAWSNELFALRFSNDINLISKKNPE